MSIAKVVRDATQDAANGLRVLVLAKSFKTALMLHEAFESVDIGEVPRKISRVSGRWSAEFPSGGILRFYSANAARTSARGWSADRVYMPAGLSDETKADVVPVIAASEHGAIIEYP